MIKGITKGANLVDVTSANSISAGSGYGNYTIDDTNHTVTSSGDAKVGFIAKVEPSTQYTVKALTTNKGFISVSEFTSLPTEWEGSNFIKRDFNDVITNSPYTFTTTADTQYVLVGIYVGIEGVGSVVSQIMLNSGSSPLPYEPYQTAHDITRIAMWDNGVEHEGWEVRDQQGTILWAADKTLTGTDSIPLKGYGLPLKGIEIEGNETQAATQGYTLTADAASIDYQSDGSNLSGVGFGGNMSQSGTPTPTVPITPEECGERTSNLFNKDGTDTSNGYESSKYIGWDGGIGNSANHNISEYISIPDGTTYLTISNVNAAPNVYCQFYDSTKTAISIFKYDEIPKTVSVPANAKFVRCSVTKSQMENFMLNSGSTALPYEPYGYKIPFQNGSTSYNIYLKEPLRKIGDYKDSVGVDGVVTRRIKKLVLTGTETNYWSDSYTSGCYTYYNSNVSDAIVSDMAYCSHYTLTTAQRPTTNYTFTSKYDSSLNRNVWAFYKDDFATLSDFRTWISGQYENGTPVTLWCALDTPTTESTTIPTVATTSGSNTLTANTTLAPSSVTIAATSAVWPGNPIQPEECGEKTVNLLDFTTVQNGPYATATVIDDGISISGIYYVEFTSVNFEIGESYSMSWVSNATSGNPSVQWRLYYTDGTYSYIRASGTTMLIDKDVASLYLYVSTSGTCSADVTRIMLVKNSVPLPYEPYGKYKLPLTLAGTTQNVYLDAPLRKIGTYADKLNADGTVTRRMKKLEIPGDNEIVGYEVRNGVAIVKKRVVGLINAPYKQMYVSSHFMVVDAENKIAFGTMFNKSSSYYNLFLCFDPDKITDLQDAKDLLNVEYNAGRPVTIWYILSEPTTEQTTIPTLTPNTGADTLTVDTSLPPSNTEITLHAKPIRYGFKINKTNDNSDTAVTYTYDAVTMTPAAMNFTTGEFNYGSWANAWFVRDAYPVALNLDGTEAYRLDPDDYTKKTDGTASDIQFILLSEEPSDWSTQWKQYYTKDANDNYELNAQSSAPTFALNTYYKLSYGGFQGNFMVAFPRVYFRRTEDATYNYVEISNHKLGDDWYAYAHVNSSGNEVKRIYLPLFKGVIVDSKLRSVPGVIPQGGTTASAEVTAASALGSRWQIWDHSSAEMINDLLILMSKSIDSQGKFGKGRESGYDSGDTVTYGKLQTGTLVKGGKFKGFSSSYKEVKVFGMEGFWANRWDRLQGMLLVDNVWKIKMTPPYNFTGTDFITLSSASVPSGNGYLSKVQTSQYGSIPASIEGGASSKFYKDYFYKTATSTRVALRGGACNRGANCGFRYVSVYSAASTSGWNIGASPLYK